MDERRTTIGARNPFALAELQLKKPVLWKSLTPGKRRKVIEDACECSYAQMFEPSNNTPVFAPSRQAGR